MAAQRAASAGVASRTRTLSPCDGSGMVPAGGCPSRLATLTNREWHGRAVVTMFDECCTNNNFPDLLGEHTLPHTCISYLISLPGKSCMRPQHQSRGSLRCGSLFAPLSRALTADRSIDRARSIKSSKHARHVRARLDAGILQSESWPWPTNMLMTDQSDPVARVPCPYKS